MIKDYGVWLIFVKGLPRSQSLSSIGSVTQESVRGESLYRHKHFLNWGALPPGPHFRWGASPPTPPIFLISFLN